MVLTDEIIKALENFAPTHLAEDFDNVGFLAGRRGKEINKILLSLDVDETVAEEAINCGAQMIISHHPVIFNAEKWINDETALGRTLLKLIENNISVYSAHTNMDIAEGGLNNYVAKSLGLNVISALDINGGGRICEDEMTMLELIERVKVSYKLKTVKYTGDINKKIKRIAICSGSGGSLIQDCIKADVDVFITGDVKYSQARELFFEGISHIDLGHYNSEIGVCSIFKDILTKSFGNALETIITNSENVFKLI